MQTILLLVTPGEENYIPFLKPIVSGKARVVPQNFEPTTVMEVVLKAKQAGASQIVTSSAKLLQLLLGKTGAKLPSLDTYAGSIFRKFGCEFLITEPLEQLPAVAHASFLQARWWSKFLDPASWMSVPKFSWRLFEPKEANTLLSLFSQADLISADIETDIDNPLRVITCISFTALFIDVGGKCYDYLTIVVPFTDTYNVAFARTILGLPNAKVFQNGKYDNAYLLRYNSVTRNWAFDTINMFHAWYCELPKDLGLITAFCLRDWVYHKDESRTNDLMAYYEYNAKDSFVTAMDCLAMLNEMPQWALDNFLEEFPLVFPCLLSEMVGIKCDSETRLAIRGSLKEMADAELESLRRMVGNKFYNPRSPQQTTQLYKLLGSEDIKGTGKIPSDKVASRHPLNKRIISKIRKYREVQKLSSVYTNDAIEWHSRIYYALNPHGTDTTRLASKESAFWCGIPIQVIPREQKGRMSIKDMFISDTGFFFGESDYAQNEAWGAAFLSGDKGYIKAVSNPAHDFHSYNASQFFGIPYHELCKTEQVAEAKWLHERILKDIIDIEKRIVYGVSYNMTAGTLLDTMGIENVIKAKHLLQLPTSFTLKSTCQYLLNRFDETYPGIRGAFYEAIKSDIGGTSFLVSAHGHHRFCFGDPRKSKRDMNRYAAHKPQNLAAGTLNKAYRSVFYNIWLPNQSDFKLGPQIHDSIWFQYRKGRTDLALAVKKEMEMTIKVKDIYGIVRDMTVPVDLKGEHERWSKLKKISA